MALSCAPSRNSNKTVRFERRVSHAAVLLPPDYGNSFVVPMFRRISGILVRLPRPLRNGDGAVQAACCPSLVVLDHDPTPYTLEYSTLPSSFLFSAIFRTAFMKSSCRGTRYDTMRPTKTKHEEGEICFIWERYHRIQPLHESSIKDNGYHSLYRFQE